MIIPPPPLGGSWSEWGERLNTFLIRTMSRLQVLLPNDSASDDAVMLWNRTIKHAVVSVDGEYKPLAYGYNAYGMFFDFTDQSPAVVNTPQAIVWGQTAYSEYVSIDVTDTSKVLFAKSGTYKIDFSAELLSGSGSSKTFYFWPRVNGVDVQGSTMVTTISTNGHRQTVARSGIFEVSAGDYLQAMFAVDSTDADLFGTPATAFCPASPSATLAVIEVAA